MVRIPEVGVTGLILPHCMNIREAEGFVKMVKLSPLGRRAVDRVGADAYVLIEGFKKLRGEALVLGKWNRYG